MFTSLRGVLFIQAENRQIILAMRTLTQRQMRRRMNTKRTKINRSNIGQV